MSQVRRSRRSKTSRKRRPPLVILARVMLLGVILALLGIAAGLVVLSLSRSGDTVAIAFDLAVNPDLSPAEAAALGTYLSLNQGSLSARASADSTPITFEVAAGQSASDVADALYAAGLITDTTLFRYYLRYYGLDSQLEAGVYDLSPDMTIPEIALALTHAGQSDIEFRATEGWRREQMADAINADLELPFTGADFLAATGPGVALPEFLATELPPGASLEGFLFPDTYRLPQGAVAGDLVQRMLANFEDRVTVQMRADAAARGLTLFQVVTLASIVEREAAIPDERPVIASVYLNRLAIGMNLQADPTVQYAMGYQPDAGQWWNLALTQDDYHAVDSPYNTYLYLGLPPGPIANPGLDAIEAAIYPAETDYLYLRAACDGSGRHNFAVTFEEHVANACP
jgi:UPF0755 protein